MNKRSIKNIIYVIFRFVFVFGVAYIILEPLLTMVSMSFMRDVDIFDQTVRFIPRNFTLNNFSDTIIYINYWEAMVNTAILSFITAFLQAVACVVVGYGFGYFNFRGKSIFFGLVILTMVVPPQLILTPLYLNFHNFTLFGIIPLFNNGEGLRLLGSYVPFILLSATAVGPRSGLYIFLARQAFRGMPKEIAEAASIDGAGPFRVLVRVLLPGVMPIMTAIFLFSFVWQWTDSLYSFMFLPNLVTLASMLSILPHRFASIVLMQTEAAGNLAYFSIITSTSILLTILPPLFIYAVFQKRFIQSIERTGIVG